MSKHPPFKQVEASRPDFESSSTFQYTKCPQPDWKPGQGASGAAHPNGGIQDQKLFADGGVKKTYIPYENISVPDTYKLLINSVVPRPVCFCSTLNENGDTNLAPFSYFAAVGHNPPIIMVSFAAVGGKQKDSAENIKLTRQFVANIISEPFIEAANYAAINAPADVSEWTLSGLTPEPSVKVKAARCKEAAVSMECEVVHTYEMFDPQDETKLTATMVLGQIKAWHVREDILVNGGPAISIEKLMPVSRMGGLTYSRSTQGYELPRPVWEQEKERAEVQALLGDSVGAKAKS